MDDQSRAILKGYAVLTGDLIRSSALSSTELARARDMLLQAIGNVREWKKGLVRGRSEFFRGDAWQVLLTEPAFALRVALFLFARLKAQEVIETRIAIGIGTVDDVAKSRVSLSSGEAFILSGRALDGLGSLSRIAIALPDGTSALGPWMTVVGNLCDSLASHWKKRQAEIVALALSPENLHHEAIAKQLNLTRQAVTKSLGGANWHSLKLAVDEFHRTDWAAICANDGRKE